jgi:hypothetical protein
VKLLIQVWAFSEEIETVDAFAAMLNPRGQFPPAKPEAWQRLKRSKRPVCESPQGGNSFQQGSVVENATRLHRI